MSLWYLLLLHICTIKVIVTLQLQYDVRYDIYDIMTHFWYISLCDAVCCSYHSHEGSGALSLSREILVTHEDTEELVQTYLQGFHTALCDIRTLSSRLQHAEDLVEWAIDDWLIDWLIDWYVISCVLDICGDRQAVYALFDLMHPLTHGVCNGSVTDDMLCCRCITLITYEDWMACMWCVVYVDIGVYIHCMHMYTLSLW